MATALAAGKPAADHVAGDAARQVGGAEGAAGHVRGLAELVATGEGEGIHDGKYESNNLEAVSALAMCTFLLASLGPSLHS